jgi:small GTP-binding protein
MTGAFNYDVFLSHSSRDRDAARELGERLRADGLRVWLDEWEIKPGDMIGLKIQRGLEESRTLVLAISANASESEWVTFESQTIQFSDPTNQQHRFIPLRLDSAEIANTLRQFAYVDWRQKSDEQYAKLVAACRPPKAQEERATETQVAELQPGNVLGHHESYVQCVAMTVDGRWIVSGSADKTVRIWDAETGACLAVLEGHSDSVYGVAVTSDGRRVISGSFDKTVRVWNVDTASCTATLEGHTGAVTAVAVAADGSQAISASADHTMRVWDVKMGRCLAALEEHTDSVNGVALTPCGRRAVSGSADNTVRVWDMERGMCLATLKGHTASVLRVAITSDGGTVFSGSLDKTARVWSLKTGKCIAMLEGHTDSVLALAATPDGRRVVSGSSDRTVRVWDIEAGKCLAGLGGHTNMVYGVAVRADGRRAISGSFDKTVRVWDLPPYDERAEERAGTRYTNAKVLLVGETGVGKTGLAYRLTEDRFVPSIASDGAWAAQLKLPHQSDSLETEHEIWLWDFAGQADYRLIHQLFMDETALAVLVFNPQSENPFDGLGQWDRDLQRAARRPFRKLLVAGRCDRGGLMVSRNSIERFRHERGFADYIETSAYTGDGCAMLRDAIIANIAWGDIPWTASPRIFKLLKQEIVKLKDEGKVLLRMGELKQQLEMRLPGETFTLEQCRAVVGLLAGPGTVWQLEFGDFVLLQPERVNAYAAAVIRKVRTHLEEIGVIHEEEVLAGDLEYQGMKRLPPHEEQIVLQAMHHTFVNHGLCLREPTEVGALLVFPSYFKRERPEQPDHPLPLVTYQFSGALDEIYATLVVKLRHTAAFDIDDTWLWRFAADFKTQANRRVGFYMTKKQEGAAELAVYCDPNTAEDTKVTFIRYIHDHLKSKDENVIRLRHYICPNPRCAEPVESARAVENARKKRKDRIPCQFCGKKILLRDLIEEKFASERILQEVRALEEKSRRAIDSESRELLLLAHASAIASEAGQIFRPIAAWTDWGICAEIEFKDDRGQASGRRVLLQLNSHDLYQKTWDADDTEVLRIRTRRHATDWRDHSYPLMLVTRDSDAQICWMNITEYLRQYGVGAQQIIFDGEPFTALSVIKLKERLFC